MTEQPVDQILPPVHPGEVLQQEFLEPLGLTHYRLAKEIGVQQTLVSQIVKGKRSVTPETALRLARYFGTTPHVWLNLQRSYDLELAKDRMKDVLARIMPREHAA